MNRYASYPRGVKEPLKYRYATQDDYRPKVCVNSKCNNIFYVLKYQFFLKDTCDKCCGK